MSGVLTHQGVIDVVLRAVRSGQLLALVLPPVSGADCLADPKRLENLSGGLVGASAVNPEIADGDDVTFNDLKGMEDKLIYVLNRAPHFITSAKVKKALKEGLSAAAIVSVVVVLVAWAASHFFGVGFAIDAILLAIGFVMIGWAIFGAMKKLLKCLKLVKNAESLSDLDKAAEMMADAIVALGVETLIGLLTRGAGRMKAKSSGGNSGGAAGGGKPRTQKEIEADNKAKADAAKKKVKPTKKQLEGPLGDPNNPDTPASTFRSGQYTEKVLDKDTTFHRAYGGKAGEMGQYMSSVKPTGPLQSTLDSALNPEWGNTANKIHTFTIPKGTTVYTGVVGPQGIAGGGALYGGGPQTFIPWKTLSGLGF